MKKKGFTLAELLGVIIVIGLLALLILPAVDRSIDNSKNKAYEAQIKNLERVAEDWAMEHMGELPKNNGEFSYVYLGQLVYGGYVDDDIRDPRTGKRLSYAVQIKISRKNNSYVFEVVEGSGIDGVFDNGIMISLNGNDTIDIAVGDTYNELGAVAKTFSGLDVSDRIEISGNIDTTTIGTYFVTYKLSYEGGTIEKKRTVNVKNTEPVITLNPNGTNGYSKALTVGVNVSVFGSNSISSLTYRLNGGAVQDVVNNTITFDASGVYTLEIKAVDSNGNTSTLTSNEYYVDATPPTITFAEGGSGVILTVEEAESYNLMTGVSVSDSGGDSNITLNDVVTSGSLSTTGGSYTITYTVTDKVGNVTTKTRTVLVKNHDDCFTFDSNTGTITNYNVSCGGYDVVIPSYIGGVAVTSIGDSSFRSKQLTSVVIPEGITSIGQYSFSYNKLTSVTIPSSVNSIDSYAFRSNLISYLSLPDKYINFSGTVFLDNQLPDDKAFIYKRNSDGSIDNTVLVCYGGAKRENVVVPSNVKRIGNSAFRFSKLVSVVLPENLERIDSYAFMYNNLETVTFPFSVTIIDQYSFSNNKLTSVTIPANVTTIGSKAFEKTSSTNPITTIINQTGRSFNWKSITVGSGDATFVTGTIPHANGDITVTSS